MLTYTQMSFCVCLQAAKSKQILLAKKLERSNADVERLRGELLEAEEEKAEREEENKELSEKFEKFQQNQKNLLEVRARPESTLKI